MVLTNQFKLPSEEELTVPELNVTAAAFATGAFHLGKYCEEPCKVSQNLAWLWIIGILSGSRCFYYRASIIGLSADLLGHYPEFNPALYLSDRLSRRGYEDLGHSQGT